MTISAPPAIERVRVGHNEIYLRRVLTGDEAARTAATVLDPSTEIRDACWYLGDDLSTIGAPLYRNRDHPDFYAERARATNRMLYNAYADLYERVAAVFEARYAVPVAFVDELAIPGFHVMWYDEPGRHEGGGWHVDQLAWQIPYFADRAAEVSGIVNFTLPLLVPSGGTGMDLLDESGDWLSKGTEPAEIHVRYRPGVMLFNECEVQHRIGPSTTRRPREVRLTLQGHGVLFRGKLLLFW
jgi:hypothetical protein